jgi:hypothetical protein
MVRALIFAGLAFNAYAAAPALDIKGTYTLVSQTCDDGTVLPGSNGGTIKITFDGSKMTLTDARSPGQKISTAYRMEGDKLINTNQRTKTEVTSKIEIKDKTMTMTSELPKDEWESKKICPKGGKKLKSVYTKS